MLTDMNLLPAAPVAYLIVAIVVIGSGIPVVALLLAAEPVLIMATMQVTNGHMSLPALLALTAAASVAGDVASFLIGYRYGRRVAVSKGARKQRSRIMRARKMVERHGMLAVIAQRWFPPARGFAPVVIGAARMPFGRFLVFSAAAAALWSCLNVLPLYFAGPQLLVYLPAAMGALLIIELFRRLLRRRRAAAAGRAGQIA